MMNDIEMIETALAEGRISRSDAELCLTMIRVGSELAESARRNRAEARGRVDRVLAEMRAGSRPRIAFPELDRGLRR